MVPRHFFLQLRRTEPENSPFGFGLVAGWLIGIDAVEHAFFTLSQDRMACGRKQIMLLVAMFREDVCCAVHDALGVVDFQSLTLDLLQVAHFESKR